MRNYETHAVIYSRRISNKRRSPLKKKRSTLFYVFFFSFCSLLYGKVMYGLVMMELFTNYTEEKIENSRLTTRGNWLFKKNVLPFFIYVLLRSLPARWCMVSNDGPSFTNYTQKENCETHPVIYYSRINS